MDCALKGRLLKNLLVFLRKIEDLTFFFIDSLRTEGKKAKTALSAPDNSRLHGIEHVGVYFAKTGCKIEDGFTDVFGFRVRYFLLDRRRRLGLTFTTGFLIRFAAKREKWLSPFEVAQPSLFFPHIDFIRVRR